MPPVNFLDLVPEPPTQTVVIETRHGPQEIELTGIPLRAIADIAKRFPTFAKVLDATTFDTIFGQPAACAAIIAAALGRAGDQTYENHIMAFPTRDILKMTWAVIGLTFPRRDEGPLPAPAAVNGVDGAADIPSSPPSSSN